MFTDQTPLAFRLRKKRPFIDVIVTGSVFRLVRHIREVSFRERIPGTLFGSTHVGLIQMVRVEIPRGIWWLRKDQEFIGTIPRCQYIVDSNHGRVQLGSEQWLFLASHVLRTAKAEYCTIMAGIDVPVIRWSLVLYPQVRVAVVRGPLIELDGPQWFAGFPVLDGDCIFCEISACAWGENYEKPYQSSQSL